MTPEELARRSAEIAESAAHAAWWAAAGSALTALLTLGLLVGAILAWKTAKDTLNQAKATHEQVERDSIEQTRPYVYAHLVPSLSGIAAWDLIITNTGKSTARELKITCDGWPEKDDDITIPLRTMFATPQSLPPGATLRTYWKIDLEEGNTWADGTTEPAGMKDGGVLKLTYTSDDVSHPRYTDSYRLDDQTIGLTPTPYRGPEPKDELSAAEKDLHKMLAAIASNIGALGR